MPTPVKFISIPSSALVANVQLMYISSTKTKQISTLAANSPSKSALAPTRGSPTMVATAQLTFTANPTNWISTPAANTKMLPTLAPTQVKTVLPAQLTPSTVSASQLTATATPGIQSTATPGFRVTVVTSDVYGAGTDALLYIALIGTDGRKSGLTEIVSEPEHFETGR